MINILGAVCGLLGSIIMEAACTPPSEEDDELFSSKSSVKKVRVSWKGYSRFVAKLGPMFQVSHKHRVACVLVHLRELLEEGGP